MSYSDAIMADEMIDIFDEDNKPLHITKLKSQAHQDGSWHRAAHIWIYNNKQEVLLQLRQKDKDLFPNVWDVAAAGHVSAGEEPITSAIREVQEEIGLTISKKDLQFVEIRKEMARFQHIINNEFYYVYLLAFNGDPSSLTLQKEEVQEIRFIAIDTFEKELKTKSEKYLPHGQYWLDMIERIKEKVSQK